jgi:hypothetical protein
MPFVFGLKKGFVDIIVSHCNNNVGIKTKKDILALHLLCINLLHKHLKIHKEYLV